MSGKAEAGNSGRPEAGNRGKPEAAINGRPVDVATVHTLAFVTAHVEPPARLLEVGCGRGDLAAALVERGFAVVAIDTTASDVESAAARGVDARQAEWPHFDATAFDAVLFTRSLHHIHDLNHAVRHALAALTAGGVIVVEDFAYTEATTAARRWIHTMARLLADAGALNPANESLVQALLDAEDPVEAWDHEHGHGHGHELHTATAMQASLREHCATVHEEAAPYLYRYLIDALADDAKGADILGSVLDLERETGLGSPEFWVGRRWVGAGATG